MNVYLFLSLFFFVDFWLYSYRVIILYVDSMRCPDSFPCCYRQKLLYTICYIVMVVHTDREPTIEIEMYGIPATFDVININANVILDAEHKEETKNICWLICYRFVCFDYYLALLGPSFRPLFLSIYTNTQIHVVLLVYSRIRTNKWLDNTAKDAMRFAPRKSISMHFVAVAVARICLCMHRDRTFLLYALGCSFAQQSKSHKFVYWFN